MDDAARLIGLQRARELSEKDMHAQITIAKRTAESERRERAEAVALKALSNPRPVPKRKQQAYAPLYNFRLVRRYDERGKYSWLCLTEVSYSHGKPHMFNRLANHLGVGVLGDDVAQATHILRNRVNEMLAALSQPILDEKADFGRHSDSAT